MRKQRQVILQKLNELSMQEQADYMMGDCNYSDISDAYASDIERLYKALAQSYGYSDYNEMESDHMQKEANSPTSLLYTVYAD